VADGMTRKGWVFAVTIAQALKLILRRRFQGTVTKSTRSAGWTGLCFVVIAELPKVVLVCSASHVFSIESEGAQKTITRGSSDPTPTGGPKSAYPLERPFRMCRHFMNA
jgi:hypothetical protein